MFVYFGEMKTNLWKKNKSRVDYSEDFLIRTSSIITNIYSKEKIMIQVNEIMNVHLFNIIDVLLFNCKTKICRQNVFYSSYYQVES